MMMNNSINGDTKMENRDKEQGRRKKRRGRKAKDMIKQRNKKYSSKKKMKR